MRFDVGLHPRAGVDDTRALLDFGVEFLVVELVVSFKGDAVDDRVFDDLDDEHVADPAQIDVGEQTGRKQRLQGRVEFFRIPRVAGLDLQVGADGVGLDPLRADDLNGGDDTAAHRRYGGRRRRPRGKPAARWPRRRARQARRGRL